MYVLYADELFLENLIIDYILLIVTAKLTGMTVKRWRAFLAALLGGVYGVLAAVSRVGILSGAVFKTAVGVLMVLIVFGAAARFFRVCLVFFGVSAGFAGAVMAAAMIGGGGTGGLSVGQVSLGVLILAFAISYAVFTLVFRTVVRRRVSGGIVELTIENGRRSVKVTALADTGNSLVDPMTGGPVTVCGLEAISALFDAETVKILRGQRDVSAAMERLAESGSDTRFFLIPYSAVGTKGGMLLAFRPDAVIRGGKKLRGGAVAIAPEGLARGLGWSALTSA